MQSAVEFSRAADDEITRIASIIGGSDNSGVVRSALSLYSYVVNSLLSDPDRRIAVIQADGDRGYEIEKIINVPGIPDGGLLR
jgi:hypothetical protein